MNARMTPGKAHMAEDLARLRRGEGDLSWLYEKAWLRGFQRALSLIEAKTRRMK